MALKTPKRRILIPDNNGRIGDWLQTFTDKQFWPLDPRAEEIDIQDIAHSLSMQCRYLGHCKEFYSVAEHSVWVSSLLPNSMALWGLLHDAAEAYLGDLIRPLKHCSTLGRDYKHLEGHIMMAVADKFNLGPIPPAVRTADEVMRFTEKAQIMGKPPAPWFNQGNVKPAKIKLLCLDPKGAERMFMQQFTHLTLGTPPVMRKYASSNT